MLTYLYLFELIFTIIKFFDYLIENTTAARICLHAQTYSRKKKNCRERMDEVIHQIMVIIDAVYLVF